METVKHRLINKYRKAIKDHSTNTKLVNLCVSGYNEACLNLICGILSQIFAKILQFIHPVRHEMAVQENDPGWSLATLHDHLTGFLLLPASKGQDPQLLTREAHFL